MSVLNGPFYHLPLLPWWGTQKQPQLSNVLSFLPNPVGFQIPLLLHKCNKIRIWTRRSDVVRLRKAGNSQSPPNVEREQCPRGTLGTSCWIFQFYLEEEEISFPACPISILLPPSKLTNVWKHRKNSSFAISSFMLKNWLSSSLWAQQRSAFFWSAEILFFFKKITTNHTFSMLPFYLSQLANGVNGGFFLYAGSNKRNLTSLPFKMNVSRKKYVPN